ncbi:MAG: hypothetical protein ACFFAL_06370 [Promethearchaeota archaeon]
MTHPHAYRIYSRVSRKFNPWIVIGFVVGFLILIISSIALENQSKLFSFIDPAFSSFLSIVSFFEFYLGIIFLFILVLSHVGAIQNCS